MKRYSIYINGYGAEVTQGYITQEQSYKILELAESDDASDLGSAVQTLDIDDDNFSWWEIDENFHKTGPYLGDSTLFVEDENQNIIYQIPCIDIVDIKDHTTYDIMATEGHKVLTCYAIEKGTFWEGYIEVESFDPKLIRLYVDCLEDTEIIGSIHYDGSEINDLDHYDTISKDFQSYIS